MIWPFKKKKWGGLVRVVMISNKDGEPKRFEVQHIARTDSGGRYWKCSSIYYSPEDAMEDAASIYDAATSKRTVMAE